MHQRSVHKFFESSSGPQADSWTALQTARVLVLILGLTLLWAPASARAFTAEQVDKGRDTFRLQCARCHGPDGQGIANIYKGMTAPELIGPTAFPLNPRPYQRMRHFQFRAVRDIYEFASAVMPADQPASLTADDYWDVIAFLLNSNGVPVDGRFLTEDTSAKMSLAQLQQRATGAKAAAVDQNAAASGAPIIEGQNRSMGQSKSPSQGQNQIQGEH